MSDIQQTTYSGSPSVTREQSEAELPAPTGAAAPSIFDIGLANGETRHFLAPQNVRAAILAGEVPRAARIGGTALPNAKSTLTVEAWAKANDTMRPLYEPVWSHTMKGALYGGLVVAALKLLDTLIEIAQVNGQAALMFAIVMAFLCSPKYKP